MSYILLKDQRKGRKGGKQGGERDRERKSGKEGRKTDQGRNILAQTPAGQRQKNIEHHCV